MAKPENDNTAALPVWVHATTDIPAGGLKRERTASEAERSELAERLNIPRVDRLVANYTIGAITGGGWRLKGTLAAELVQACVVTLEPIAAAIDEGFDVEFWPAREAEISGDDKSVLSGPDIEPLARDEINVGRIVFETVSAGLDPYPRKGDANFDWHDPAAADPAKTSPFAVLSKLRDKN